MKKVILFLLAILLCIGTLSAASAENAGTCGENLTWSLDNDQILTISGTGRMEDYRYNTPWYMPIVRKVVIENGVTAIGKLAFYGAGGTTLVEIPDSVQDIRFRAIPYRCTLVVGRNSYARKFADENGYDYVIRGEEKQKTTGAKTVGEKVREVIANEITPDMSDYRKAVVLHNWLCRNCEYDYEFATSTRFSAAGALLKGMAVCSGYADAYSLLLSAAGIENRRVTGNAEDDHEWNAAKLDGKWVFIDVTWDDEPYDNDFNFDYFAVTGDALRTVDNHRGFSVPFTADSYQSSHAYRTGILQVLSDDWMKEIGEHIARGETSFNTAEMEDASYVLGENSYGVNAQMATQMLRDTGFTLNGKYYPVAAVKCTDGRTPNGFYCCTLTLTMDPSDPNYGTDRIRMEDHDLQWDPGIPVSCLTDGIEPCWICSHCGQKFRGTGCLTPVSAAAVIPAKGHTPEHHREVPAGCEEPGTEEYWQCTGCGSLFSDEKCKAEIEAPAVIPAEGHHVITLYKLSEEEKDLYTLNEFAGYCEMCERAFTVQKKVSRADWPGDANHDKTVDGRDALRLMKYLAGDEGTEIDGSGADVNMDGKADEADLLRMMQYFGGETDSFEEITNIPLD